MFDEIHKYPDWKNYLKGFFDTYKNKVDVLVTGSARLDIYRKGGDSLMGRYFPYRVHPLTVAELISPLPLEALIREPADMPQETFNQLITYGGFPDPYLHANRRFSNRWSRLRQQQLLHEDIRSLAQLQEIAELEKLLMILESYAGQQLNYSNFSKHLQVTQPTIKRWIQTLSDFYFCFRIQPWSTNIVRSLIKEPKLYLWDWSLIQDIGARHENFIASHLLKAVHYWTDHGLGEFDLYYLRDLDKREVDFCVTRDSEPWFLVEVKTSAAEPLSPTLQYYQEKTGARHAFQVVIDLPHVQKDCFSENQAVKVPASTFLSQLF
jgi:predicted AAA+ superfamily ATPase